ncbi:uncharacterized protein LOC111700725 [Eurytemora carolleeae]|uniref:uncharacterized protein LOC111700725 n=1 Tax=Eurytemora carolleeae TaxID=1294199 RepID=UPI000C781CEA|nr:uncharacterized protein LOC111700725 [Eurytemora carolleeae]|eukprot:XP_023327506.1 uncharacterized protein LOC111700725 [Eurytemora affinis]
MASRHNINPRKPWTKPRIKVYDINRLCGEYYYQPMIEYINNKDNTGRTETIAMKYITVQTREPVRMPSSQDLMNCNVEDLGFKVPRIGDFLSRYGAKKIKEMNSQTVHTKNEMLRQSKNSETIPDKRTSTLIRNQYIREVSSMYQGQKGPITAESSLF